MARCSDNDSCKKPAYYQLLFLSTVLGLNLLKLNQGKARHKQPQRQQQVDGKPKIMNILLVILIFQATIQESDEERASKCCDMGLGVEQSTQVRAAESSRNRF
ncbi:hypothetical protein H0E87_022403 [Populus deltoides]|uniref:Uncharacterized protein n=1 Tax=Populus deltoides TaxID=3696 RepID=A0A8T2XIZ0_POPDE|nr:hypothetical protein H0E87_022403 [Populus deltoides]